PGRECGVVEVSEAAVDVVEGGPVDLGEPVHEGVEQRPAGAEVVRRAALGDAEPAVDGAVRELTGAALAHDGDRGVDDTRTAVEHARSLGRRGGLLDLAGGRDLVVLRDPAGPGPPDRPADVV